uniref:Cytochrome P450 n=1 Tax=Steinernema glaseri TaxID=37863 RepID=A0A1I7ZCB1_9BILA
MAVNFLLVVIIVTAVYVFFKWRNGYWKRRGIDGPDPLPFVGNILSLLDMNSPPVLKIREWTKKYGKVYGIQEGWRNVLVVSDVDMLQELFVKKFENFHGRKLFSLGVNPDTEANVHVFDARGARWKRLRNLSNPSFSVNNLKKIMPTVQHSVDVMVDFMERDADTGKSFNIHSYYQELTMDIIARIAMGQKGTRQFENEYLENVKGVFMRPLDNLFVILPFVFPILRAPMRKLVIGLSSIGVRRVPFRDLLQQLEDAVKERKEARDRGEREEVDEFGNARVDFIDLFLDVETETIQEGEEFDRSGQKIEKKLTTPEIVAQCLIFLLAGFDTTANSLAYASFCLATNPEVQRRLQEEIDEVCVDSEVTYEQLQKLTFMDKVVKEALRLYPLGAFANARLCMKTTTLGDIKVEKGTCVQADVFSVHYDPALWENPEQFNPDRWDAEEKRHLLAWFPFGAGPRTCVGLRLAYMEEKLALIKILRRFNIVAAPDTEKKLELIGGSVVQPRSVTVRLESR